MTASTGPAASMAWIEAALIIFFVVFLAITIAVLIRKRGHFDEAARIPFKDAERLPSDGVSHKQGHPHD